MNSSFQKISPLKASESERLNSTSSVVVKQKKKKTSRRIKPQQDYYKSKLDSSKLNSCFILLIVYIVVGFVLYQLLK